ncbi:MAG TPA: hypothetical protein VI299_21560, partial [Polyangiales bacterium]
MIQRLARFQLGALLAMFGCAQRVPHDIPRTLGGVTSRGAFVPPSAYEAYVRGELALAKDQPAQAAAQLELATS